MPAKSSGVKLLINAQTMTGNLTSTPFNVQDLDNVALQLNFTGTPTGTFSVEVSLDYDPSVASSGNWVALSLSSTPAASGSANQILLDLSSLGAPWVRVKYTFSSGTGTLNVYAFGKSV
jgi:hypothetical protein